MRGPSLAARFAELHRSFVVIYFCNVCLGEDIKPQDDIRGLADWAGRSCAPNVAEAEDDG